MENKYNPIPFVFSFFLSWKYPSFLHCKKGGVSDLKQWLGWGLQPGSGLLWPGRSIKGKLGLQVPGSRG